MIWNNGRKDGENAAIPDRRAASGNWRTDSCSDLGPGRLAPRFNRIRKQSVGFVAKQTIEAKPGQWYAQTGKPEKGAAFGPQIFEGR